MTHDLHPAYHLPYLRSEACKSGEPAVMSPSSARDPAWTVGRGSCVLACCPILRLSWASCFRRRLWTSAAIGAGRSERELERLGHVHRHLVPRDHGLRMVVAVTVAVHHSLFHRVLDTPKRAVVRAHVGEGRCPPRARHTVVSTDQGPGADSRVPAVGQIPVLLSIPRRELRLWEAHPPTPDAI